MSIKYKTKKRKKYNYGGTMYQPNVITPGLNSTTNTLFEETDPQLQEARMLGFEDEVKRLTNESETRATEIETQKEKNKQTIEQNAAQTGAKFDTGLSTATSLVQAADKGSKLMNIGSKAAQAGSNMNKATRLAGRANRLRKAGKYGRAAKLTKKSQTAARMGKAGQTAGQGLKSFATSAGGIGLISDVVGMGVKAVADDKDATTWKAGEIAGDLLQSTGKGVSLGAQLGGGVGAVIGGVVGLGYGTVKGITQRARARRDKSKMEAELAAKTRKGNLDAIENFGMQKGMARAGELKTKTYSGYDLGRNTTAKYGGLKRYI